MSEKDLDELEDAVTQLAVAVAELNRQRSTVIAEMRAARRRNREAVAQ